MRSATVGCVILLQRRPKKLGRQRKKISLLSRLGGMANNYGRSWWWFFEKRKEKKIILRNNGALVLLCGSDQH